MDRNPASDLRWQKGRPCDLGTCVEIATAGDKVLVRSTLSPAMLLTLTCDEWREFLTGAKEGLFDDL